MRKKKSLGQHFLHDQNVLHHIVEVVDPKTSDNLIEIGPGAGALTSRLLPLVDLLNVIEIDKDVIPELEKNCDYSSKLQIHLGDVLKFDFAQFGQPIRLVGNLPYNISTPLLFYLLKTVGVLDPRDKPEDDKENKSEDGGENRHESDRENKSGDKNIVVSEDGSNFLLSSSGLTRGSQKGLRGQASIQDMHFMLQKEVAERIAAKPGTKVYGRLSVMLQYHCETKLLFGIGPRSFSPPPKVDSAFIRLVPRKQYKIKATDESMFADVVRDAFNHRRKTIANGLKRYITASQLEQAGIDSKTRPEQLSVEEFVVIANFCVNKCSVAPGL